MASQAASRINSNARSKAMTVLGQRYRIRFMVYELAHAQAGAKHPRNEARADLASLYPEQYRELYAQFKAAALLPY